MPKEENVPADAAVLDIGTGNGSLLVELAKSGFTNLTGIDYSAAAVELAKNVLEQDDLSNIKVEGLRSIESCPRPASCSEGRPATV
uniref:Methyltransferase domain-containing protein n=1 Tax=Anguilla anguilla TaxID=7936 RepID=A0A0E9X5U0_ANGAN